MTINMDEEYYGNIRLIEIAANLTDPMFSGMYKDKKEHQPDLYCVLQRSWENRLDNILILGTDMATCKGALDIARHDERLGVTLGCHPLSGQEVEKYGYEQYFDELVTLAKKHRKKVKAVGETGLDYYRTEGCPKEVQMRCFEMQLKMSKKLRLPLLLHCRDAFEDFHRLLSAHKGVRGVVHSFDGTSEQAQAFIDLGFYLGISGCSLKTEANLEVVKGLPPKWLMVETDAPWCRMGPTYAGYEHVRTHFPTKRKNHWRRDAMISGRSEPSHLHQIIDVISAVQDFDRDLLSMIVYQNAHEMFFQ